MKVLVSILVRMKLARSLFLVVLSVALLVSSVAAARWQYVDRLNAQSYQLFVREWGKLSATCSAGAYWTDGKTTRLLTAGHCIALAQDDLGSGVEFLVTQTGSEFLPAKVLDAGWVLKDATGSNAGRNAKSFPTVLPYPGFLKARSGGNVNIERGDWAILEIPGKHEVAALGDSAALKEDDAVYMYGYPLGGDRFFARGFIANPNYRAPGTEWSSGYFAADITAAPGNSGSMIVDEGGKVVAILVAGAGDRLHILTPLSIVQKNSKVGL